MKSSDHLYIESHDRFMMGLTFLCLFSFFNVIEAKPPQAPRPPQSPFIYKSIDNKKQCPCSSQCTCGCNEGGECCCGEVRWLMSTDNRGVPHIIQGTTVPVDMRGTNVPLPTTRNYNYTPLTVRGSMSC